jgi:queuine tRNA-ribosyltransferase
MSEEILGLRLNTLHNVHFLLELMRRIRRAILAGEFVAFKDTFLARYRVADAEAREANRRTWKERGRAAGA